MTVAEARGRMGGEVIIRRAPAENPVMSVTDPIEPATDPSSVDFIIEEFQAREREFQRHWNRNAWIALPGFVLFVIGAATNTQALVLVGMPIFMLAVARGVYIVRTYRRCPSCESVVSPGMQSPYTMCRTCGAQLSYGIMKPGGGDSGRRPNS